MPPLLRANYFEKNQMKTASIRSLLLQLILTAPILAAVSCAHTKTYVEPSAPAAQLAALAADAPLWLVSIDGEKIPNKGWSDHKEIKIQSGAHTVEVSFAGFETVEVKDNYGQTHLRRRSLASRGSVRVPFSAGAGKTYVISYKRSPMGTYEISGKWQVCINEFQPAK